MNDYGVGHEAWGVGQGARGPDRITANCRLPTASWFRCAAFGMSILLKNVSGQYFQKSFRLFKHRAVS